MPQVSVITPVYCDDKQKADWVIETIESVQSQSFENWEMILIDDKSPFEPSEAKYKFTEDKRVRWFNNASNFGPSMTRNTAVALAESECILPLDCDDMLASETVMEDMLGWWLNDRTKIIYGNVQTYMLAPSGEYIRNPTIFSLPEYNFSNTKVMLNGNMSVTAMHSVQLWDTVKGWKPDFTYGLEDVEYWYSAGLAGFCGQKINVTTLLYRKHQFSRTEKMKEARQFQESQKIIIGMHSDALKKGIFPMSCCGKNNSVTPVVDPIVMSGQAKSQPAMITPLPGYKEEDLEWVAYNGPRQARFDILARGTVDLPNSYTIFKTGQFFQIHKKHHQVFASRQRLGFAMNQQDPRKQEEEEENKPVPDVQEIERPATFQPNGDVKLATIERIDTVAAKTRQIEIVERKELSEQVVIQSVERPVSYTTGLGALELSEGLTDTLQEVGWTIRSLSVATPDDLIDLPRIGSIKAQGIINKARELRKVQ